MISDILSDAAANIRDYAKMPCYQSPDFKRRLKRVLKAMDDLRKFLDTPPLPKD